jgi:hypothetical protein
VHHEKFFAFRMVEYNTVRLKRNTGSGVLTLKLCDRMPIKRARHIL